MDDNTAFVPATPLAVPQHSQQHHHHQARSSRHRRNTPRSSAGPPPRHPGRDGHDNNKHKDDDLEHTRSTLEHALRCELTPRTAHGRTGQCECIWCGGSKQRRCSWCDGRGVRYEVAEKSWDELADDLKRMQAGDGTPQPMREPMKIPVQCSACSGSKKLRCAYCGGSGIGSYGHSY